MSMCDRCVGSLSCYLNVNGKACKDRRKRLCPDVVYSNADRIRDMDDEELGRFLASVENRRSAAGDGAIWNGAAHAIQWLQESAEEG